ncbi:MAG: F0F1 ATP synthase subunit epsilon [Sphingobacteriia bacterium]|nr:F0F1 ATP synthase subunit epsilon [Sphingobacteriia bacterium]
MYSVRLITPEKLKKIDDAKLIQFEAFNGQMGVMPGHEKMMVMVKPGIVTIDNENEIFITGGFAEIKESEIIIISEEIVYPKDITHDYLQKKIAYLQGLSADHPDYDNAFLTVQNIEHLVLSKE